MKEDFKKMALQSWVDFSLTGLPADAANLVKDLNALDSARKRKKEEDLEL